MAEAERLLVERGGAFTMHDVAKEAGVALQTLYRLFSSKDHLLLAIFEDMILKDVARYETAAATIDDPLERLRVGLIAALDHETGDTSAARRFLTAEYWRLYELFPEEMARVTKPFVDVTERRLREAIAAGVLRSDDPAQDAWLVTKLVMAIFHHRAHSPNDPPAMRAKEHLWAFCLSAWQT